MIYAYVLPPTYSSSMKKLLENFEGQASQKNGSGMKNTQWKIIKRECKSNHKQTVKAKRQSLPTLKHVDYRTRSCLSAEITTLQSSNFCWVYDHNSCNLSDQPPPDLLFTEGRSKFPTPFAAAIFSWYLFAQLEAHSLPANLSKNINTSLREPAEQR